MIEPVITFWPNLLDPKGAEWQAPDWETVFGRLSQRREFLGNEKHPGWSPARLEPLQRAAENVRELYALCLDFDGGVSVEWALDKFAQFSGLVQTTRKHTPEVHRFRVVLPLSRSVSPFEHGELWKRVALWCGNVDPSTKDPARFWFLAGCAPDGEFRAERLLGERLAVDAWLARALPSPSARRETERNNDPSAIEQRAIRYVAKMPEALAGSRGHDATWQVACALACGFDLSEEVTFQILWNEYNPRCQPAWSEKELQHKARHARHNTKLERGYLLRDDHDWSNDRRVEKQETGGSREPGDDSDEIEREETREQSNAPTDAVAPKPIHERFALFTERQLITQVFDHLKSDKPKRGFTTGVHEIDAILGGLRLGMVACVGAQTSWGKSTFATMVLEENLKQDVKVLIVSNEDMPLLYGRRIVCRRGGMNALSVRDGDLIPRDIARVGVMAGHASDAYVLMNASGVSAEGIAQAILVCREELGTQLIMVDYLQRIRTANMMQDRRNEVSRAAECIGDAIKKHSATSSLPEPASGLVFSQLKRIQDREPTIEDLKESGDVENMAEHIILGHRKVKTSNQGEENVSRRYNIPKNKDGPVILDWVELEFNQVTASFTGRTNDNRPENVRQFDDFGDPTASRYA